MEGFILVWDLNDVLVITRCAPSTMNRVRGSSICLDDDKTIVSGWKDGFLRAFQITNKPISPLKWELVNAHKGSITSVYAVSLKYIIFRTKITTLVEEKMVWSDYGQNQLDNSSLR